MKLEDFIGYSACMAQPHNIRLM